MIQFGENRARNSERGFTLVEAVVAFAIVSVALGALYQVFAASLQRASLTSHRQQATLLAQSMLARTQGETPIRVGTTSGQDAGRINWIVEVRRYERRDEAGVPAARDAGDSSEPWPIPVYDVTVRVKWGDGDSQQVVLRSLELGTAQ